MDSAHFIFPKSIKALLPQEKAQWPVSVTTAPDGAQIVISRYGDPIWDFWPYVPQENRPDAHKRINWALELNNGERLTDPQYAGLMASCKDFLWSLFADPVEGRKRPKMVTIIGLMKEPMPCLIRWMVSRGVVQFRLLSEFVFDFVSYARQGVSPKTAGKRLALVESLYLQAGKIADALSQHPWEFETAAGLSGEALMPDRYKPKTPLIPEAVLKRIATIAIDYVERRAPILLDARDAIEAAGSHRDRIGGQSVRTVAAKEWCFPSARVHSRELMLLKTACYIVIGLFSGIRDSELLSLGVGCISPYMTRDGIEARWLHGTIYKTGYRPKKWLVPPIVETAVKVMERFSAPMRARLAAEERALLDLGSKDISVIKRLHKVQNQKGKLFLATDNKFGNLLSVMSGATAGGLLKRFCRNFDILGTDGKPWPLAPHQFRRVFAYNYAKSEMGDLLYLQEHYGHHSLDMTLLYSDEGTDGYYGDTELLEMIAAAKRERQVEILTCIVASNVPLAAGGQWIGDWRRTIRTAKNKDELIEELSGTIALTGTGHSWCAGSAKGTGCGSRCMFEPDMCTECNWAIISQEHLPVWREIGKQQEAILACDDIGAPGQALARRVLAKAKLTIAKLEGQEA